MSAFFDKLSRVPGVQEINSRVALSEDVVAPETCISGFGRCKAICLELYCEVRAVGTRRNIVCCPHYAQEKAVVCGSVIRQVSAPDGQLGVDTA